MKFNKYILLFILAVSLIIIASLLPYLEFQSSEEQHQPIDFEEDKNDTVEWEAGEPELDVTLNKDRVAGFNVKVDAENFTFKPEGVNHHHVSQEGHGHIYVNGEQIRRFYNPKTHFYAPKGTHKVTIVLASHDHQLYEYEGEIVKTNHEILKEQEHNLQLYQ